MSKIYRFHDHTILLADYEDPESHKHLLPHIVISFGMEIQWKIEGKSVTCRGICIDSNILHACGTSEESSLIFLFTETSRYAVSLRKKLLKGNHYSVIPNDVVDRIIKGYYDHKADEEKLDDVLLKECGIDCEEDHKYEKRIKEVLIYIDELDTIEHSVVEDLSNKVYLSKSRLSHLFKEETGMTLHSYLAYQKLWKAFEYFHSGRNITDACMMAGFDSPSHFSATCKRMFGISLSNIYKSLAE